MYPYDYALSLRIKHPEVDPQTFTDTLGRQPEVAWRAGERRTTPNGDLLEGHRTYSYWTSRCTSPDDSDIEAFIRRTIDELKPHRAFFINIRDSGGKVEFFVGLFVGYANMGFTLTHDLMSELGCLGIDLSLDIYDWEDEEIASVQPTRRSRSRTDA